MALDVVGRVLAHRAGEGVVVLGDGAIGDGEDAQAIGGVGVVRIHDPLAQLVGQLDRLAVHADALGEADDLVRGTLDVGDAACAVEGLVELVDGRHALAAALEGQLADARGLGLLVLGLDAGLLGGDEQAGLGRVAEDGEPATLLLGGNETGVGAERAADDEQTEVVVILGEHGLLADVDLALGRVADACDLVLVARGPEVVDRHLVLGEGAGLVGADDARRTEGLDRGELLHEGVALGHALDGHGE